MKNAKNGEVPKAYNARCLHAMNISVSVTFAATVAVILIPTGGSIALTMALLLLTPAAIILYKYK